MADSKSNSSSGSSDGSGSRSRHRRKISGDSKRSSQNSKSSDSDLSLSPRKCLSNEESIFQGQGKNLYESVDEDREIAAKAVAIVVSATRKGVVSLCAEVAALLKSKKRLELALAAQKKSLFSQGNKGPRMSNSSGSGSSITSKDKSTSTYIQPLQKCFVHQSTNTLESFPTSEPQHCSVQTESVLLCEDARSSNLSTSIPDPLETSDDKPENVQILQTQLQKALASIKQLEAELCAVKSGIPLTKPRELYCNKRCPLNKERPRLITVQSSPCYLETLNQDGEFPNIVHKTELGHAHEGNCTLKSCVKHRNKMGLRPFSSPFKVYPSTKSNSQVDNRDEILTTESTLPLSRNTLVPSEPLFIKDKKLQFTKAEVLPKIGDHVAVHGEMKGVVKHIGPIHGELKTYVGLHLDSPVGNNNGTLDGVRYFCCPHNYGAFVPIEDVTVQTKKAAAKETITVSRLPSPPRELSPENPCTRKSSPPLTSSAVERQTIETAA